MAKSLYMFALMTTLLSGTTAIADSSKVVSIQTYLNLGGIEAALEFDCERDEKCEFSIGELEARFILGQRTVSVRIRDRDHDYVFFNQQEAVSVDLGPNKQSLPIYDQGSSSFVLNDQNDPVGYLEVVVTEDDS